MKQLLDMLEERINVLLKESDSLRQENKRLQAERANASTSLQQENHTLREALTREQAVKETAVRRIDALLARIKERLPE